MKPFSIKRLTAAVALAFSALVIAGCGGDSSTGDDTSTPQPQLFPGIVVAGPIATIANPYNGGDAKSDDLSKTYPFFSAASYTNDSFNASMGDRFSLAKYDYVEEEFYIDGKANAYESDGTKSGADVPYRTRVLIRRPANAAKFNGVVVVEWQNVTAQYDLDALWAAEHMMQSGYVWVGASVQHVGVDQLVAWSPTRYGDKAVGGKLDVTGNGKYPTDQLSYSVFAQTAAAVRNPPPGGPKMLGGDFKIKQVLATGASQSGSRMTIFYNSVRPVEPKVFDGYEFVVSGAPTTEGTGTNEPIFLVTSETETPTTAAAVAARRPDSKVFRHWEVAGGTHSGYDGELYRHPLYTRDLNGANYDAAECNNPKWDRVPLWYVVGGALDQLVKWVDDSNYSPPTAPYIQLEDDGVDATTGAALVKISRNPATGLAKGGIQLSQVSVPIAYNDGKNTSKPGETDLAAAAFCRLWGTYIPFKEVADGTSVNGITLPSLRDLYPTSALYLTALDAIDQQNLKAGYIAQTAVDASHADAVAAMTNFGY